MPKCPECEIELTEIYGNLQCELCGYIDGETPEQRYARELELTNIRRRRLQ